MKELDTKIERHNIKDSLSRYKGTIIESLTRKTPSNNTTGIKGVSKRKDGKYTASITLAGKQKTIGAFWEKEDAIKARKEYEKIYFEKTIKEYKETKTMELLQGFKELDTNSHAGIRVSEPCMMLYTGNIIKFKRLSPTLKNYYFKILTSEDTQKLALVFTEEQTASKRKISYSKKDNCLYISGKKILEQLTSQGWQLKTPYKLESYPDEFTFIFTK